MITSVAAAPVRQSAVIATPAARRARAAALVDTATRVSNPSDTRLPPPSAPKVKTAASAGARSFVESARALDMAHMDISKLGDDSLTAAFLKLNISDPNNNVETHDALYTAASNLRQLELEAQGKQIARAEELQKEAMGYAQSTMVIGTVLHVGTLLSTALAAYNPAMAAVAGGICRIGIAAIENTNKRKNLAVRETQNQAARIGERADEDQKVIQDESDIVNTIMETKNAVIDSVMKMIDARGSSAQILMTAAIAR